jgi:putative SOS response-associated peptidase YedK
MCGRYVVKHPTRFMAKMHRIATPLFEARYNVAPSQLVPVVKAADAGPELATMRWGLIPSWAKDAKIGYKLINARSETVASKPSFRSAFKRRRCLIPADGFFEWKKLDTKTKQPHFIHLKDDQPFAFAGLWEIWHNPEDGEEVQSCTIITTEANEMMKPLHDRMPVILAPSAYDRWLAEPDTELLKPYTASEMIAYPVSTYVNTPKNQGPKCIELAG